MIRSQTLEAINGIRHGFFTRQGGTSQGIYASLNTGLGSDDDRKNVVNNRQKIADALSADKLVTPYQHHSADAVVVRRPVDWDEPPEADATVTREKQIAIAINTADCTPVLFASGKGDIIGATHAGWKGAVGGVLESTVLQMEALGAERGDIFAAIGPTISWANYEVGPEFQKRFVDDDAGNARFFEPSPKDGHYMFDLPGFVAMRLENLNLAGIEDVAICTYADEDRFFSYRRTTHRSEPDYGRQLSAIMITD
ncbi:MAG: peptidoglycan editing factor PgeF [Aestuariivirgaceae bacterium]